MKKHVGATTTPIIISTSTKARFKIVAAELYAKSTVSIKKMHQSSEYNCFYPRSVGANIVPKPMRLAYSLLHGHQVLCVHLTGHILPSPSCCAIHFHLLLHDLLLHAQDHSLSPRACALPASSAGSQAAPSTQKGLFPTPQSRLVRAGCQSQA